MIRIRNRFEKPLQLDKNLLLAASSQPGVSPDSKAAENTPNDTPKWPRLQANTCGPMRPQADWRGSTSVIKISDLGGKCGPMRTQANLYGRYFLVAEEGSMDASYPIDNLGYI